MTGLQSDKTMWNTVRFGDMVQHITERVEPTDAEGLPYVGLEHLDSESLRIQRWGSTDEVAATKLRFYPGDIIFGKRRFYQKKLAVADFEGICSAHAMVLRAKPDVIHLDFLPFFMQSDTFFNRAMAISVGSLSPTINWSTLARQEFALPPLDEQQRIAELLWAVEELFQVWEASLEATKMLKETITRQFFERPELVTMPLSKTGNWSSGGTPSRSRPDFWRGDYPWVSPKDMKTPILSNTIEHITEEAATSASTVVPEGSILVVTRGMILAHTFPVAIIKCPMAFNQDIKALVPSNEFLSEYVLHWLEHSSDRILSRTSSSSHGTKRLPTQDLLSLEIPYLSIDEQVTFVEKQREIAGVMQRISCHIRNLKALKNSLLATCLEARSN